MAKKTAPKAEFDKSHECEPGKDYHWKSRTEDPKRCPRCGKWLKPKEEW